jgi:hypothetical protein
MPNPGWIMDTPKSVAAAVKAALMSEFDVVYDSHDEFGLTFDLAKWTDRLYSSEDIKARDEANEEKGRRNGHKRCTDG